MDNIHRSTGQQKLDGILKPELSNGITTFAAGWVDKIILQSGPSPKSKLISAAGMIFMEFLPNGVHTRIKNDFFYQISPEDTEHYKISTGTLVDGEQISTLTLKKTTVRILPPYLVNFQCKVTSRYYPLSPPSLIPVPIG